MSPFSHTNGHRRDPLIGPSTRGNSEPPGSTAHRGAPPKKTIARSETPIEQCRAVSDIQIMRRERVRSSEQWTQSGRSTQPQDSPCCYVSVLRRYTKEIVFVRPRTYHHKAITRWTGKERLMGRPGNPFLLAPTASRQSRHDAVANFRPTTNIVITSTET